MNYFVNLQFLYPPPPERFGSGHTVVKQRASNKIAEIDINAYFLRMLSYSVYVDYYKVSATKIVL